MREKDMKNKLSIQDINSQLQKLSFEEKSSYLSQPCPPDTAIFPNQTIGQYLFSQISVVNDKFHTNTTDKSLAEFMKEHNTSRDNLLKLVVGEDYFPYYMQQLENLRTERCQEIMDNTPHLYHFSQKPPNEFGTHLVPHFQLAGNALSERINESLCYAAADKESSYIIKPPSNQRKQWEGVSIYMDEKAVMVSGYQPKEFLDKQTLSYRYEVNKSTFNPNVSLDGRFTNEYESSEKAQIIQVDGPFSIIDMTAPREQGGWDIPVYFIPNKEDKKTISEKINELRGLGATRTVAMKQVSEQFPEQLIFFNENEELLLYARNLEIEKEKHRKRQENDISKQHDDINLQAHQRKSARENVNKIMIKRGFQNPKNQQAAAKYAEKKEKTTGKQLTEQDIKKLKLKTIGSKNI